MFSHVIVHWCCKMALFTKESSDALGTRVEVFLYRCQHILVGSNKSQGWKAFCIDVNMFWWNTRRLKHGKYSILSIMCSCFSTIRCLMLTFTLGHCDNYDETK
mgnify:CR=1 FL=1